MLTVVNKWESIRFVGFGSEFDNIRIAAYNEGSDPISEEEEIKLKNIIREVIKEVREGKKRKKNGGKQ